MKKSLLIVLSIFFMGSCSTTPEDGNLTSVQISEFASVIKDEGLYFSKKDVLFPFEIASNGTYKDAKGVLYKMTSIIDDNTVISTSVDYGEQKHVLIGGAFGATFQEIAFSPISPDSTLTFREKVNAKALVAEKSGSWSPFSIAENGTYTTDGIIYTLVRFIREDTYSVSKNTGGSEIHGLVGDEFVAITGTTISRYLAFKKVEPGELTTLRGILAEFIFADSRGWTSLLMPKTLYKVNGVTYDVGKLIDANTVLVAKSPSGTAIHKLTDGKSFGPIGSAEIAFKKATTAEINTLKTKLVDFTFHDTVDGWKDLVIDETAKNYILNGATYDIGRIVGDTVQVYNSFDVKREDHSLYDSNKKYGIQDTKEIAFKKITTAELTRVINQVNPKLLKLKGTITLFEINPDSIYTDKDANNYTIGRYINDTTVEVSKSVKGTRTVETNGLRGSQFGKIVRDAVDPANVIALEISKLEELKIKLAGFKYSTGTTWADFPIIITASGAYGSYKIGTTTYNITDINTTTWTVEVSDGTGGTKTHKIIGDQYGPLTGAVIKPSTEIAVKPTDPATIKTYAESLRDKKLIYPFDGHTWGNLTISDDGKVDWLPGSSYKIIRIYPDATGVIGIKSPILVSSKVLRQELHQFVDPVYLNYEPPSDTAIRDELAFVPITSPEFDRFNIKITALNLKVPSTGARFSIDTTGTLGKYTHAGTTYTIGRYIDDNTICVALGKTSTAKHGLIGEKFGILNTDGTIKTIIAESTASAVATLKGNLTGFVYPNDLGAWADFPGIITDTGTYTVRGTLHTIRSINGNTVTTDSGVIHKLIGDQYGPLTGGVIKPSSEIAVKRDIGTIRTFTTAVNGLNLTGLNPYTSSDFFQIKEDIPTVWTYVHNGNTYEIGRMVDADTALVAYKDKTTGKVKIEIHGLKDGKYGILNAGGTTLATVVAKLTTLTPEAVGTPKFSSDGSDISKLSFAIDPRDGTPYVAYKNNDEKSTVMKFSGDRWDRIGDASITTKKIKAIDVAVHPNDNSPYIAIINEDNSSTVMQFDDGATRWNKIGGELTTSASTEIAIAFNPSREPNVLYGFNNGSDNTFRVKKFTLGAWEEIGNPYVKADVSGVSFAFAKDGTPYFSSKGWAGSSDDKRAVVMKLAGGNWNPVVSGTGAGSGEVDSTSLAIHPDTKVPYVAYKDGGRDNKIRLSKYNNIGDSWADVGGAISDGGADMVSLAIHPVSKVPYVAYKDNTKGNKVTLKRYVDSRWETMALGFSVDAVEDISLVFNNLGDLYVAYKEEGKITVQKFNTK